MRPRQVLFQLLLLVILVPLAYGPVGHYLNLRGSAPDLFLVATWAFAWLTNRTTALTWAVLLGLTVDLINFTPFGLWTVVFVGLVLLVDYLKSRFFAVSSILEALLTLFIANVILIGVESIISRTILVEAALVGLVANVLIGLVVYYLLVMRLRLTERWEGRRL